MHVVCARIHFRPRWYALEKGDDMCSNIAAARDVGLLRLFHQRINTFCTVSLGETEGPQRFIRAIHIRFSTNNRLPETSFSLSVFHTKYSLFPRFSLSLSLLQMQFALQEILKGSSTKNARLVPQLPRQILTNLLESPFLWDGKH